MRAINVLSCFDGISCGQLALGRAGFLTNKYFASEIDKFAIQVTQKNFPDTIQLGDITNIEYKYHTTHGTNMFEYFTNNTSKIYPFESIDLLIGGSPCQSFSSAGKQAGFDGTSGLISEFFRLVKDVRPKYFLLENVVMKDEWKDIISKELGVQPILINSSLVSAQNRKRYYWTNIPNITQPADKNIKFHTICKDNYIYTAAMRGRRIGSDGKSRSDNDKSIPIQQFIEWRTDGKTNCLTTVSKDNVVTKGYTMNANSKIHRELAKDVDYRNLTVNEMEELQTLPLNYTDIISNSQRVKAIGNGWTVDVISHILKNMVF